MTNKGNVNRYLNIYSLKEFPVDKLTFDICKQAFEANSDNFKYIPEQFKTLDMIKKAIEIDIENIRYVPKKLLTIEIAQKIVFKKPNYIKYIPAICITKEIAHYAFNYNYRNIEFIPDEFKTRAMCINLFEIDPIGMWKYIPEHFKTIKMCQIIFEATKDISLIPNRLRTKEMWNKYFLIHNDISKIPESKQTQEMWNTIFYSNPIESWDKIPELYKSQELCDKIFALTHDISLIPEYRYTPSILEYFLKQNGFELSKIPKKYWNKNLYNYLFMHDYRNIRIIPTRFITKEMCDYALSKDFANMWKYIPIEYRTEAPQEKYDKLFELTHDILQIPSKNQTQEMWNVVFKLNGCNINIIPIDWRTSEMIDLFNKMYIQHDNKINEQTKYYDLLNNNPVLCFEKCPPYLRTRELYSKLIQIDVSKYMQYVPDEYCDEEMIDLTYNEISKLFNSKSKIKNDSLLLKLTLKKYPSILKVMGYDILYRIVVDSLLLIVQNGGTLEYISKKYDISTYRINAIINRLEFKDKEKYQLIKDKLKENAELWLQRMEHDCSNLCEIIDSLGEVDNSFLPIDKKIKFSYLYYKRIYNPIESIYDFAKRYENNNWSGKIIKFLDNVFKYDLLNNSVISQEAYDSYTFNNTWIDRFNKRKFLKLTDDISNFSYTYNGIEITTDMIDKIVKILVHEDIPLSNVIVRVALKEYINNNLDKYISYLHSLDIMLENSKAKKRSIIKI